jgi:hypothetical protein
MIRQRYHQATKTYTTRRIAEGRSEREIRRCLKRTVARGLFRLLTRTVPRTTGGPGSHAAWRPAPPR